jgi:hypothetical protein
MKLLFLGIALIFSTSVFGQAKYDTVYMQYSGLVYESDIQHPRSGINVIMNKNLNGVTDSTGRYEIEFYEVFDHGTKKTIRELSIVDDGQDLGKVKIESKLDKGIKQKGLYVNRDININKLIKDSP